MGKSMRIRDRGWAQPKSNFLSIRIDCLAAALSFLILAGGAVDLHGNPAVIGEKLPSLYDGREVVVIVKEDYGSGFKKSLPYFEFADKLLRAGGVTAIRGQDDEAGMILRIESKGWARSAQYASGMLSGLGRGEYLYTGVSIEGTIVFTNSEGAEIKAWFSGVLEPPKSVTVFPGGERFETPEDAPFLAAWEQSSFAWELGRVLAKAFGASFLAPLMKDEDVKCRLAAVCGMTACPDPSFVEPLILALQYPEMQCRRETVYALGKLKDPRAVDPLIQMLKEKDPGIRRGAIWALGQIKDIRAEEVLIATLKDPEPVLRLVATSSLGDIAGLRSWEPVTAMLLDPVWSVRAAAARSLMNFKEQRTVEALIPMLKDKIKEVRQAAVEALANTDDPKLLDIFISLLKDQDEKTRKYAASGLGNIKHPGAIEPLLQALRDNEYNVCWSASMALAKMGSAAVEPLIAALESYTWYGRELAADALGRIKDPRAVDPLIRLLRMMQVRNEYGSKEAREAAVEALGELKDPRAVEPLIASLHDGDAYDEAIVALGKIGHPRAAKPLISWLRVGWDMNDSLRQKVYDALLAVGKPCVELLVLTLKDSNADMRIGAAELLRQLGDPKAIPPLREALNRESHEGAKYAMTWALKELEKKMID